MLLDSWGKQSRIGDANRIAQVARDQRQRRAAGIGSAPSAAPSPQSARFRDDVIAGLSLPQKALPPKYFYDATGSRLFERICRLREYYPTRVELALTRANLGEIARFAGTRASR